jgi:hypothetical protein
MEQLRQAFAKRSIPGPPCSMGVLLANVTPEDRQSLQEAMQMIQEHRAKRGPTSNHPPNAAWLRRLIERTMHINMPAEVISRHMRGDCRCRHETR